MDKIDRMCVRRAFSRSPVDAAITLQQLPPDSSDACAVANVCPLPVSSITGLPACGDPFLSVRHLDEETKKVSK